MNLLIPGSSGFIGTNFKKYSRYKDITDVDLLVKRPDEVDYSNADAVLHLSALVHQMKGAPEKEYFLVNADLAYDTALAAKQNGVKQFILMSTVKVYGEFNKTGTPWNENSPVKPEDPYGKSKLQAERRIMKIADDKFKVAIIRTPLVYGPGVKGNMINLVKLIDKYKILPFGNIHNQRSMAFVGNLIALADSIIEQQASGIFLAGDENPVSTSELVREIAGNFQGRKILVPVPAVLQKAVRILRPAIYRRLFGDLEFDNKQTREKLKYTPEYTFEQGIREMVEWYKGQKFR